MTRGGILGVRVGALFLSFWSSTISLGRLVNPGNDRLSVQLFLWTSPSESGRGVTEVMRRDDFSMQLLPLFFLWRSTSG
jgi:hypothetical protein